MSPIKKLVIVEKIRSLTRRARYHKHKLRWHRSEAPLYTLLDRVIHKRQKKNIKTNVPYSDSITPYSFKILNRNSSAPREKLLLTPARVYRMNFPPQIRSYYLNKVALLI